MFDNYFEVFLADTAESKAIHYSIRYQVYCEEMGFENKDDFPLEQEFDDYDDHSAHFIVRHKQSGQWVGAMRLIRKTEGLLPVEQYCRSDEFQTNKKMAKTVELSRLCVLKEIRKKAVDINPPYGVSESNSHVEESDKIKLLPNFQNINRSIIWGILNAASEYCYINNIFNWYFMTTNALAKVLNKGGFNMIQIGEPIFHRGERFPFKKDVKNTYFHESWRKNFINGCGYRNYSELKRKKLIANVA